MKSKIIRQPADQESKIKNFLKSYIRRFGEASPLGGLSPNTLLILIILIGSFLRLQGVFTNSFAFTYDVGRDMLALWNIVYEHKIPLIGPTTGIPGVFYGPWWYFILTPFFLLFQGNPQGIAFVMSAIGILSIYLSYYVGKRIGNSFLGLSMALLASISPLMISLSSQIWNPNIAPLFVLLTMLVLERIYILKNKARLRYFFILGILLALNIDIEILWGIFFSFGIFISLIVILRKKLAIKQIISTILGVLVILSPRIIFDFRHGFLISKSFLSFLTIKTLEDKLDLYHFLENRVLIHLDEFSKSFMQGNNYLIIPLLLFILISILLFYKKASQITKNFILTSFIVLLVFFVGTLIFSHALWPHYLVGLPVIYIFLLSVSLFLFSKRLRSGLVGIIILIVLFIIKEQKIEGGIIIQTRAVK